MEVYSRDILLYIQHQSNIVWEHELLVRLLRLFPKCVCSSVLPLHFVVVSESKKFHVVGHGCGSTVGTHDLHILLHCLNEEFLMLPSIES